MLVYPGTVRAGYLHKLFNDMVQQSGLLCIRRLVVHLGLPKVMISTGGRLAPSSLLTSPMCFILGKRFVVTLIGKGSTSDANTGSIPLSTPPKGKPPEPSNRLPRVNLPLFIFDLHLFYKVGVHIFLSVSDHIYAVRVSTIFHESA